MTVVLVVFPVVNLASVFWEELARVRTRTCICSTHRCNKALNPPDSSPSVHVCSSYSRIHSDQKNQRDIIDFFFILLSFVWLIKQCVSDNCVKWNLNVMLAAETQHLVVFCTVRASLSSLLSEFGVLTFSKQSADTVKCNIQRHLTRSWPPPSPVLTNKLARPGCLLPRREYKCSALIFCWWPGCEIALMMKVSLSLFMIHPHSKQTI